MDVTEKDKIDSGWDERKQVRRRETESEMTFLLDVYINTSLCSILLIANLDALTWLLYIVNISGDKNLDEWNWKIKSRHKILKASYRCHRSLINGLQSKAVRNCRTRRFFYINWPHLTITSSSPCEFLLPYIQTKWSEVQVVRFWQIYEKIVISFANVWY